MASLHVMRGICLFILGFALPFSLPASLWAATDYEESLKLLAENVVTEAIKARKQRLAFLDFTDSKGNNTPLGQFLAEEIGTQILIAGELHVVERTLVRSTLNKLHVVQLDRAEAKAVRRAAKAIRADVFISGTYLETPDGVQVTAKLVSPLNVQTVGAVRGVLPKAGPLDELIKEENRPPEVKIEGPKEPPLPTGLGFHRNEYYELVIQSIEHRNGRTRLNLTVENRSSRDLKILCFLQSTILQDDRGTTWQQDIEDNRDGLCTRGLELSSRQKKHAVLTFTGQPDAAASQFTLHYHEKSPRQDTMFTIEGLNVESGSAAVLINP